MAAGQAVHDVLQNEGRSDVDADRSGDGQDQADDEADIGPYGLPKYLSHGGHLAGLAAYGRASDNRHAFHTGFGGLPSRPYRHG